MNKWHALGSGLVSLAWVPVLLRFVRSFRERKNPISLAICLVIVLAMHTPLWVLFEPQAPWSWAGVIATSGIVCAAFHASFTLARRRFPNGRRDRNS